MRKRSDLDALLYRTARKKNRDIDLPAALEEAILAQSKPACPSGGDIASIPFAMQNRTRRRRLYACIAAAAIACIAVPLFVLQPVVVEGKPYIALGNTIDINGETYYLQGKTPEQDVTILQNIAGTNQYVALPAPQETTRIMLFAPDSPPQPERRGARAFPEHMVVTMEQITVYPTIASLVVRDGPGMDHAEIALLYPGQCVTKIGMYGNWAILEWQGGIAYAFDDYLFQAPVQNPVYLPVFRYATEEVNVRALPGSREDTPVLGELQPDDEVRCTGVIGNWSQIEWGDGVGYVFSDCLSDARSPAAG